MLLAIPYQKKHCILSLFIPHPLHSKARARGSDQLTDPRHPTSWKVCWFYRRLLYCTHPILIWVSLQLLGCDARLRETIHSLSFHDCGPVSGPAVLQPCTLEGKAARLPSARGGGDQQTCDLQPRSMEGSTLQARFSTTKGYKESPSNSSSENCLWGIPLRLLFSPDITPHIQYKTHMEANESYVQL